MNTSRIKSVSIKKLWGVKNISTEFNEHVNIFIGANGSSKTTFLNLIEATLLCDINTLACIEFETIEIELLSDPVTAIKLCRTINDDTPTIKYIFNEAEYEIPCNDMMYRSYRSYHSKYKEAYQAIKQELSKLINISWLSINRDNTSSFEYDRTRDSVERIKNMVDIKLQELLKKLIVYQLQLESEANKSANKFKEDSLSLMLYNESVDVYKEDATSKYFPISGLGTYKNYPKRGFTINPYEYYKKTELINQTLNCGDTNGDGNVNREEYSDFSPYTDAAPNETYEKPNLLNSFILQPGETAEFNISAVEYIGNGSTEKSIYSEIKMKAIVSPYSASA